MDSTAPIVLPVKALPDEDDRPLHPNLPKPPSLLLMISPIRTGKCVWEKNTIETRSSIKYIKDIIKGDYVNSSNGFVKVLDVLSQGTKELYKIIINEKELVITLDHKLDTLNGMMPLKDITTELIKTRQGNFSISSKEEFGTEPCYDLHVDHEDHTFYCNDISVSNSTIISNLLLNSNFFGQDYFDETIVFSPTIHNDKTSRFLRKAATCYDTYSDDILDSIIQDQSSYDDKSMRPSVALILDDVIGVFKGKQGREPLINSLASRFRHYGIDLLLMSSQNYRRVNPVIRSNCTHMIVGSPFPNVKELHKIFEELGDSFSGAANMEAIYRKATPNKYDFLYLDLTSNPPKAYRNFTEQIAVGGAGYADIVAKGEFNMSPSKPVVEEKKDI